MSTYLSAGNCPSTSGPSGCTAESACSRVGPVLLYGDFEILAGQHILVRFLGRATRPRACAKATGLQRGTRVQAGPTAARLATPSPLGSKKGPNRRRVSLVVSVNDVCKLLIYAGSGPGGRWFESTRPDQPSTFRHSYIVIRVHAGSIFDPTSSPHVGLCWSLSPCFDQLACRTTSTTSWAVTRRSDDTPDF